MLNSRIPPNIDYIRFRPIDFGFFHLTLEIYFNSNMSLMYLQVHLYTPYTITVVQSIMLCFVTA